MEYDIEINKNGTKRYYKKGTDILHRECGPAIEWFDGDKFWCSDGYLHRDNGPAVEIASGYKAWCVHGNRHRTDGPAVELVDGQIEWWINGTRLSSEKEAILNKWWDNKNGI